MSLSGGECRCVNKPPSKFARSSLICRPAVWITRGRWRLAHLQLCRRTSALLGRCCGLPPKLLQLRTTDWLIEQVWLQQWYMCCRQDQMAAMLCNDLQGRVQAPGSAMSHIGRKGHGCRGSSHEGQPQNLSFQIRDFKFGFGKPGFEIWDPRFEVQENEIGESRFQIRDSRFEIRDPRFEIRDPRFEIRDSRSEVRGSRSEIRDSRFEIRDSRFEIRDPRFEIRDSRSEIRDSRSKIRGSRSEIRGSRFEIRDSRFEIRGVEALPVTIATFDLMYIIPSGYLT